MLTTSFGGLAVSAATPNAAAAAQHLARTEGGAPDDYHLVYERRVLIPGSDATLWAGKLLGPGGSVHTVYRDAAGTMGGRQLLATEARAEASGLSAFDRKADAPLRAAVAGAAPGTSLPVAVWLSADASEAVQAVIDRHPELKWIGDRPLVDDLTALRTVRGELWEARHATFASVQASAKAQVEALGGMVAYASTSAPLVFVDLPAASAAELADAKGVVGIGLEQSWKPSMSSAGPTVDANWTSGGGDQGSGVRYAVVEYHNVRNSGDLAGKVVASHSTTGKLAYTSSGQFDHPTWVAGAVAGQSATYRGVAPGAQIVSSGTGGYSPSLTYDRAVIAAADWAVSPAGGDADIVNTSLVQDTSTGAEEARRYFDSIVDEDGRLAVAASGNYVNFNSWTVGSPGRAWNVLTVGGTDDRGTAGRGDDRIWYVPSSNGSAYVDPSGTAWNPHGDFNKPNLSAPAVSVRTANGLAASGTSVATPITGGIAAQLIARAPSLAIWPEAVRALLMAGAWRQVRMPDGSINVDHQGVGLPSALWSNRIVAGDGRYGGYAIGAVSSGTAQQTFSVQAGQVVRVVASWNSHTSGSGDLTKSDSLLTDFDLQVVQPGGSLVGSYTFDNNYEVLEFTAAASGTATIRLPAERLASGGERYALAWSKRSYGTPTRLAGADRYATAAAISRASFAPGVSAAYVASGASFADALAAGPAAGLARGPVLLTAPGELPDATATELTRLQPTQIYVVGGSGAVSSSVASSLARYSSRPVVRLAGADRYATAAEVSRASFAAGVPAAFVASGTVFADALAGGPAAVAAGGPTLLVKPDGIPAATADELSRLKPAQIYLLGGSGAVSSSVAAALAAYSSKPVVRLAGADRYATAVAVAQRFFGAPPAAYLATGTNFPDALAAVAAAGRSGSPLLLVKPGAVPPVVGTELRRLWPPRTMVLGGSGAISDAVVGTVRSLLGSP
ncbi:MAG TPA: cell wall-binding repeat-containing protein [Candidatus Limnocylindria bacterium]|nr:cell wall-binding repeat-containing protein [Candidatus Limnocylindria bacterium]